MNQSIKVNNVTFSDSDTTKKALVILAVEISDNVRKSRGRVIDLNRFLSKSGKWIFGEHKEKLQQWKAFILGRNPRKAAADLLAFVQLIESIFSTCSSQKDWEKMRGLIPEKLFEPHFSLINHGKSVGFGVNVIINGKKVHYEPGNPTESRQTVDAGAWDGLFGEFIEIKFQPRAFKQKDIGYLKLLEKKLDDDEISHKIKLLTFDDVSTTKNLLIAENLIRNDSRFEIMSHEDFLAI